MSLKNKADPLSDLGNQTVQTNWQFIGQSEIITFDPFRKMQQKIQRWTIAMNHSLTSIP
jgi:hypothetical protein